jgi:arylsulfatase A-like enzyme
MKKKSYSYIILTSLLITSCSQNEKEVQKQKPNILWIVADDLGTDIGCYGEDAVHTPNLDQFASEGMQYNNFFTVTAVCSPSRSALITGMYPTSIRSHQHRTRYKDSLPDGIRTITHYFREAGYFTCNGNADNMNEPGKQDYNFLADSIYDGTDWRQREEGQRFFAQVQIHWPHRDFKPDNNNPVDPAEVTIPPYYPDHPITRNDWALYLETIQLMDEDVGEVLTRLKEDGLDSNTIVFFFGDQGSPHVRAKQFLYDPGINTPMIIRWPGKIKKGSIENRLVSNVDLAPTVLKLAGIEIPEHLQGQDFLHEDSPAREFIIGMRDRRDETEDRIRAVRTKDYKYIRNYFPERPYTQFNAYKKHAYPVLTLLEYLHKRNKLTPEQELFLADNRPVEELYYLPEDPYEINNLAMDPTHQESLKKMRAILDDWLKDADKGIYPEPPEELEYAKQLMEGVFKDQMEKKGLSPDASNEQILDRWNEYYDSIGK